MAMFKGFKPQGMQKIASRMGYAGRMEEFDSYLQQNPDKQREMLVFQEKAQEMARGGSVVRMAVGGMPTYVNPIDPPTDPNNPFGPVGAAVMSYGYNPTTNQYSISSGGQQKFPEGFESSMDYGELYKKYPQIKGSFEKGRQQPSQKQLSDMEQFPIAPAPMVTPKTTPLYGTVGTGGFGAEGFDVEKARQVTPDPRLLELERNFRGATTMDMQTFLRPDGSLYVGSSSLFGDIYGQGGSYNQMYPSGLVDPRDAVAPQPAPQPAPIQSQPTAPPSQQAYVPTLGESAGQIPAYGTAGAPKSIGEVGTNLAQTGAIPVGAVTQPELTATNQQQIIDTTTGQLTSTPVAPTYGAETAGAIAPTTVTSTAMDAVQAAPAVQTAIQTNQAAQANVADPRAQVLAAQQTASSVSNLQAAQGTATLINNPVQRQIQSGELISGGVANAQTASNFTEQIQSATATPSEKATVQGQLATLTANFDATNPPAWAAGAIRGVQAMMQQRGLGASSMAGQALIQGVFESALPIAQADAQVTAQFEAQNLSNKQQRAMLAAQQRATFIGQEFDQAFQTRVANASKIGDIANMNFTSDQQVMLENSRATNTMNLNNLGNRQAMVIAEASALANMDLSNLSNSQQASVQNASNFLQLDMANLSNEQQTALFNAQAINQSILTDQAAQNAANQFNATSQNQVDQFMSNLSNQVAQFNSTQTNAQNQFNAGELNTLSRFNAEVANQRDQFNAQNQLAIAQNNAVWRREIATADTATINRANELNAKAVLDVSNTQYDNLWNYYADTMEWAWKSAESEQERIKDLVVANLDKEAKEYQAQLNSASQGGAAIGNLIGTLGGAALQFGFGNL